jgi:hypothetical protein
MAVDPTPTTEVVKAVQESAKAVQDLAQAARLYRPEVRDFGTFVAKAVGRPTEEVGGLIGDVIRYARVEIALRFKGRVERLAAEQGLTIDSVRSVPIAAAVPLLECASLEEDSELQELWAQRLVNGMNPATDVEIERSFVSILRSLNPFEASVLRSVIDAPKEVSRAGGVEGAPITAGLPYRYMPEHEGAQLPTPAPDLELALWNLARNGLISTSGTWGGGSTVAIVRSTPLGERLVAACHKPIQSDRVVKQRKRTPVKVPRHAQRAK